MNKPNNKKKTWIAPKIVDLDLKNTNGGLIPFTAETTTIYPSS